MQNKPFVSIIMPVYNAAKYLQNIFENVLNQTFTDWELVVVNDCSNDESGRICDEYSKRDERIQVLHLKENGGAGNARNRGMSVAKGEYITFIDADDAIELNLYEKVFAVSKNVDADVIAWGLVEEYYNQREVLLFQNVLTLPETQCSGKCEIKDMLLLMEEKTLLGYQWNKIYRSSLIKTYNIQFETAVLYEDYFFNLEFMKHANSLYILEDALYHYKKRDNDSITTRFVPEYFELSKRRISSMYELYKQWNVVNNHVINILGERYLRYILAALTKSFYKQSNTNFVGRTKWLRYVKNDSLYRELCHTCKTKDKLLKIFQIALNRDADVMCFLIGEIAWVTKAILPNLFNKIRKYK